VIALYRDIDQIIYCHFWLSNIAGYFCSLVILKDSGKENEEDWLRSVDIQ